MRMEIDCQGCKRIFSLPRESETGETEETVERTLHFQEVERDT